MHESAQREDRASGIEGGGGEIPAKKGGEKGAGKPSELLGGSSSEAVGRIESLRRWIESHAGTILVVYLIAYTLFGIFTVRFFPFYSAPYGDEATYYSYAQHPWTLISDFFEGYRPKEVMNPYNFRIFLTPFAILFKLFGFTYVGARLIVFSYGLLMLWLLYSIARTMIRPLWSLAAVVLLSVSPSFLFLTHGVRPEGMMSLFVMICVWLIIRHTADIPGKTYFLIGLISASTLMIHYNGVVLSPMLFIMLLGYDFPDRSWRKVMAFVGGGTLFLVVFLLMNFLPARETIKEFGIMPVTFVSNNKMPILSGHWISMLTTPASYFLEYFSGRCFFELQTYRFTGFLFFPMLFGLVYQSGRREWLCGAAIGLYVLFQILIIPNLRFSYAFYVIPLAYLLVCVGLSKLPSSWDMKLLATAAIVGIIGVYTYFNFNSLKHARDIYRSNAETREVLRELVKRFGPPETVTVMAGQEQHCFLYDTRFRTFHSVIQTHDLGKSLDLISPDIVLIRKRDLDRLETYLLQQTIRRARAGKATPKELSDLLAKGLYELKPNGKMFPSKEGVRTMIRDTLVSHGYVRYDVHTLLSHGSPLLIFVRGDGADVPAQNSTPKFSG